MISNQKSIDYDREKFSDDIQLNRLERQVKSMRLAILGLVIILVAVFTMALKQDNPDKILRAQGLIIEDADGQPRILVGAPFPEVKERKRTDRTDGLVLMDKKGIDRLTFGYPTLSPQVKGEVSKRINTQTGMVINDTDGNERTGYGVTEEGHVILGMDYESREALVLVVNPEGYTGMIINGEKRPPEHQRIFIGTNNQPGKDHGNLVLNDNNGTMRTFLSLKDGKTSWRAFNKEGNMIGDAVEKLIKEK
jgi:hypothetical protein